MPANRSLGAASQGLFALLVLNLPIPVQAQDADRPNIIFLLADDMRHHDMSFIDPSQAHTPNLDRLAAESTVFRNGI